VDAAVTSPLAEWELRLIFTDRSPEVEASWIRYWSDLPSRMENNRRKGDAMRMPLAGQWRRKVVTGCQSGRWKHSR
jgi:hypothetical protein